MWSSDEDSQLRQQQQQTRRAGRTFEAELQLRYLSPGAFTILPPDVQGAPPDSPPAINNYRLTPTARRHRNAAFSIIAESCSNPGSRSPSPTGRVSPFRGRGFNPIGSRHASPAPSPRHDDSRGPSFHHQQREETSCGKQRSKIPTLSRRGSNADLYLEKPVAGLPPRALRSRTNLTREYSKSMTNVSPKQLSQKTLHAPNKHAKPPAFQKLSPIVGSSPERTPESGRLRPSPSKIPRSRSQPPASRASGTTSETGSKSSSRNASRDQSPLKIPNKNNYKNVKAKVNSFNSIKPKVPIKPQVPMPKLERKNSKVSVTQSSSASNSPAKGRTKVSAKSEPSRIELDDIENDAVSSKASSPQKAADTFTASSTVVSSTTTTATKPLKIDLGDNDKDYLPDVRALSATSVSTALNRMNDTVLDTRTLMKDTNMSSRIPPTVVSAENSPATEATPALGMNNNVEEVNAKSGTNGRTHSPRHSVVGLDVLPKSANERIREARTVVATDVQPIRIMVKEKPSNPEVQSGNVRLAVSATNGISERPG
ncbi:putative uncharacterized protein ENSP00000383309 [Photinus pyralis]|nr:putative uncharacterized protein ENSP00000383309 [Photinus pyralis]